MLTKKELIEMLDGIPDNVEVKIIITEDGHHQLEIDNVKINFEQEDKNPPTIKKHNMLIFQ